MPTSTVLPWSVKAVGLQSANFLSHLLKLFLLRSLYQSSHPLLFVRIWFALALNSFCFRFWLDIKQSHLRKSSCWVWCEIINSFVFSQQISMPFSAELLLPCKPKCDVSFSCFFLLLEVLRRYCIGDAQMWLTYDFSVAGVVKEGASSGGEAERMEASRSRTLPSQPSHK